MISKWKNPIKRRGERKGKKGKISKKVGIGEEKNKTNK